LWFTSQPAATLSFFALMFAPRAISHFAFAISVFDIAPLADLHNSISGVLVDRAP
jgi:hypothetical protein